MPAYFSAHASHERRRFGGCVSSCAHGLPYMLKLLRRELRAFNFRFLLAVVLFSEVISIAMTVLMSRILDGQVSQEHIKIGIVVAFVASSLVGVLIIVMHGRLRGSELRYRRLIEDAGDAICIIDTEGSFIEVNKKMEEFSGYSKEELLRMNLSQLHPADEFRKVIDSFQKGPLAGSGTVHNMTLLRKDGSIITIDVTGSFIDIAGQKTGQAIIRDVTARRKIENELFQYQHHLEHLVEDRTIELSRSIWNLNNEIIEHRRDEEALRRSNDFSEAILNSMNDAVAIIDAGDYRIVKVNRSFLSVYGNTEEEVIGRTCHAVIHRSEGPCSQSGQDCPLLETIATGRHASNEHAHFQKTGEMRYFEDSTSPIRDDSGGIVQVVHLSRDITGRTLTELALRESEDRFRRLFEQHEDALFILNPYTQEILDANPAAVEMYGYTLEEFIGKTPALFFDDQNDGKYTAHIRRAETTGNVRIDRAVNIRKDGTKITTSLRGKFIRLKDRNVLYCSVSDITEQIRLEEEARLIQSKLIQANKMTSLGTLVSGVAHEINNPNNFILFNAQLLSEAWRDVASVLEELPDSGRDLHIGGLPFTEMKDIVPKLLTGISDGSNRIKNIVKNLKDFARQDPAGLEGTVDLNSVVTISASILDAHIKKFTEHFTLDLGKDLPAVRGSSQQLEQVVINLITNALLSLPETRCGVQVSTERDGEGSVVIRVKDEGCGMPPEILDRIMEPFFTTRLAQGGTGLGLSISYSIIKAHQGTIAFASEPGQGTMVSVALPIIEGGS